MRTVKIINITEIRISHKNCAKSYLNYWTWKLPEVPYLIGGVCSILHDNQKDIAFLLEEAALNRTVPDKL